MRIPELFRVSSSALTRHKLRAFLTLLGVIIGVATVVGVVSVISGLNSYVKDKVIGLNPDIVIFTKYGIIMSREEWLIAMKRKDITLTDMQIVRNECRLCAQVGGRGERNRPVKYGDKKLSDVSVQGHTPNMGEAMKFDIATGRYFTQAEYDTAASVGVIGWDVQDQLFPNQDPIGRVMKVAGYPVKVIGTLAKQGNVMGQSQDNVVYIPLTVFKNHVAPTSDIGIFIKPKNGVAGVAAVTDEVRSILRAVRKTKFNKDDPFGLVTAELLQDLWKNISAGAFLLMILISGISLVVGAIVIANIMFVSVVERTKEIGVRRALGARKRDIRWQFLLEAALLSAVGGAIGVMIGAGIAFVVNSVFPAQVKLSFILIGIGVATVTGLLAGWIPSSQASKLPPVEALRYE
ncbi:MAG TPA: ABC transporter permease [Thermoanaerobaculia bacterium]|nr:ABC transporter permease [Thermoanaerobaculia bacterium]